MTDDEKKPFPQSLGALRDKLGEVFPPSPAPRPAPPRKGPAKAVVRMDAKGRGGGKEVTVVEAARAARPASWKHG